MAVRLEWVAGRLPPDDVLITQVYAFCFDDVGRILLVRDGRHVGIPGGKPEGGEDFRQTALREVLEEACVKLTDVRAIGYQLVHDDTAEKAYAQLRVAGRITAVLKRATDPGTGKTFDRVLVPPGDAGELLGWGDDGVAQIHAAASTASQAWRIRWREGARKPREIHLA
jgi:ADP-ribose pyrophosphatase YjhB (NUDIX family)